MSITLPLKFTGLNGPASQPPASEAPHMTTSERVLRNTAPPPDKAPRLPPKPGQAHPSGMLYSTTGLTLLLTFASLTLYTHCWERLLWLWAKYSIQYRRLLHQ